MKNWVDLLLCLLLSSGIWLIHNLSQEYSDIVNVPVVVVSNIEGRARSSVTDATVSGRVTAIGFQLIRLNNVKPVEVFMDASDFVPVEGDQFFIPAANLYKYTGKIFGEGVNTESLTTTGLTLRFNPEYCRKVPVKGVLDLSFQPQYMASGPVRFTPDSLLIYGDMARLENIDAILTQAISLSDIKRSMHGVVAVDAPSGIRVSAGEVAYNIEVSRFVEIRSEARVDARNVPAGAVFSILPSSVRVTFKCVFPMIADPTETAAVYVDYEDFAKSRTGRCLVKCDGLPEGVIEYSIEPEICECFLETDFR